MDPFSTSVTILTLATLCVQATTSLYKTINGINSRKQDVRNLKTEVEDLNVVLQALEKNLEEGTEHFEILRLILQHCRQGCVRFEEAVLVALKDAGGPFQDVKIWTKLQFLGSNINDFRKLIGSYKATLTIALADSNLRTAKATKQLIEQYTEMIKNTTANLEEQIVELSTKLEILQPRQTTDSPSSSTPQTSEIIRMAKDVLDQRASLEQCLSVCNQLLEKIEELKPAISETGTASQETPEVHGRIPDQFGPRITSDALRICAYNLNATMQHLHDLQNGDESVGESTKAGVIQHLESARQCLEVIGKAQMHRQSIYENIDVAEDSFQTVVSTMGDLIKASGLTIGARSVNIMGQMSDESLQKLGNSRTNSHSQSSPPTGPTEPRTAFEKKHGSGYKVSPGKS